MTQEEILVLSAGRELDCRVSQRVFNLWPDSLTFDMVPEYSFSIAAAWQVVERLAALYGWVEVTQQRGGACECCVGSLASDTYTAVASGETAPLAICRAALAVTGA